MRKILQIVLNRIFVTVLIVLGQVTFFLFVIFRWSSHYVEIAAVLRLLSLIVVCYLIYKPTNPAVKLAWIIPILTFPIFGGILYLAFGHVFLPRKLSKDMEAADEQMRRSIPDNTDIYQELADKSQTVANQCSYLRIYSGTSVYKNTKTKYFADGIDYWEALVQDIETAEHFIFLEYFIIGEGAMWNKILEILEKKAVQGVEVRLIYDDFGSVLKLPKQYDRIIEKKGIKCVAFNRIIPFMSIILNNRDHRKIVVIDGKIAYTGGINLADEYINYETLHGYWKDAGIRLMGDAVWDFTVMFLHMWNISRPTDTDYSPYKYQFRENLGAGGYVLPYGDTPFDNETVGENVYLNMIGSAKRYFYAFTPYLITDNEMNTALKLAAKRGVDVKLVTPGIPDKKTAYWLTQSSYLNLVEAGVKIYQYTPGFIHSKCVLCDDETAVVGTINFDYRSFYHHFECGVYMYHADAMDELKKDMEDTFAVSEEITLEWCKKNVMRMNVIGPILKLFAPLF
ncbi:MAG: cardiolipin synthase [Butyrivibrio sp.]|nr:cardiolipin synthase [Butyrivibrio sp.]